MNASITTFYICRHGQTENNKLGRLSGHVDTPLTDEGITDALSSAATLHGIQFDKIIASDLGRAFATAYIISPELGYTRKIEQSKSLREVNYGDLNHMPIASHPVLSPLENTNHVHAGGESLAQMQQRVTTFLESVSQENPGQTILLVSHDGPINALRSNFTGIDIGLVDAKAANAHDFVAKAVYTNGKITSFDVLSTSR